jgi:hypothetical protein
VELNSSYNGLFAAFSAPRIFTSLDSNVMDVLFHVPGNTAIPAASSGFGAVFTNVDLANNTRMRFYAPDGALLFERAVPPATGNATFSFLGVSFNAGEVVGRVHIVSGNTTMGLNERSAPPAPAPTNVVAMDDFIYAEPVATAGLTVSPNTGSIFRTAAFDLVIGLEAAAGVPTGGSILFDGTDVTPYMVGCLQRGTLTAGGLTLRCAIPRALFTPGDHTLQVTLTLANQTSRRNASRWTVVANTEP